MPPVIDSGISIFTCKAIGLPPSSTNTLSASPSSPPSLIVDIKICNAALCTPVCIRQLRMHDNIVGGRLPLMVSFRSAGATDPPKSVDPAAGPALFCLCSDIICCVSTFLGSDDYSCVFSSGSDNALVSRGTVLITPLASPGRCHQRAVRDVVVSGDALRVRHYQQVCHDVHGGRNVSVRTVVWKISYS